MVKPPASNRRPLVAAQPGLGSSFHHQLWLKSQRKRMKKKMRKRNKAFLQWADEMQQLHQQLHQIQQYLSSVRVEVEERRVMETMSSLSLE